ncbi:MAG: class I SAM-dependent methyltransferase [Terriglobales bacterium]
MPGQAKARVGEPCAELSELTRSANEAAQIRSLECDVERYLQPPAKTPYPLEYAYHLLGDVRRRQVVDLGCGSGEDIVVLGTRGAFVTGVDLSAELIEVARRRARHYGVTADLRVASAYATGLPDRCADVVFCMAVLHHLDLARAKREILRLLRPGGRLILREPVRFSWAVKQLRRMLPTAEEVSESEYPLSRGQVAAISAGLELLAARGFRSVFCAAGTKLTGAAERLTATDAAILRLLPALTHYATVTVVALRKPE